VVAFYCREIAREQDGWAPGQVRTVCLQNNEFCVCQEKNLVRPARRVMNTYAKISRVNIQVCSDYGGDEPSATTILVVSLAASAIRPPSLQWHNAVSSLLTRNALVERS
jgi:hypothetical protein